MPRRIALDSNLCLLTIVGRAAPQLLERHKRLRAYSRQDFDLLAGLIAGADVVVSTPNALTEVANIFDFGVSGQARSQILASLKSFIMAAREAYVPSRHAADIAEFDRLGLTDTAWLHMLEPDIELLTVDLQLYLAASARGLLVRNFNHLRDQF